MSSLTMKEYMNIYKTRINNSGIFGSGFESYFELFCLAFGFNSDPIVLKADQWAGAFKISGDNAENKKKFNHKGMDEQVAS